MTSTLPDIDWTLKTSLTLQDVQSLRGLAANGSRGSAYVQLYAWTGENQWLTQAQISTYSNSAGGAALAANAFAKLENQSIYPSSLDAFSFDVLSGELAAIENDIDAGGDGLLTADELQNAARGVWIDKGLED